MIYEEAEMISFQVYGIPRPGGSKRAFVNPHTKRVVVVEQINNRDWRNAVTFAAAEVIKNPLRGALEANFIFRMPRPKGHYGKNGLKESAPRYHANRPDTTKLIRSTEDAMKGIAWLDDSQISAQHSLKIYSDHPGCTITIRHL